MSPVRRGALLWVANTPTTSGPVGVEVEVCVPLDTLARVSAAPGQTTVTLLPVRLGFTGRSLDGSFPRLGPRQVEVWTSRLVRHHALVAGLPTSADVTYNVCLTSRRFSPLSTTNTKDETQIEVLFSSPIDTIHPGLPETFRLIRFYNVDIFKKVDGNHDLMDWHVVLLEFSTIKITNCVNVCFILVK